jgi:excisionase family DNA binding protein
MRNEEIKSLTTAFDQILLRDDKPMSVKEAAEHLDVSVSHIYKLTHKRKITCYKPSGKRLYFKKSDLDKYLFRNEITAEGNVA